MRKHKYIILSLFVLLTTTLLSCEKYLNVVPSETISEQDVIGKIQNIEKVWANLYGQSLQDFGLAEAGGYNGALLDACTDEAKNHWENPAELLYNSDSWSAVNNPLDNWTKAYQIIRLSYILLENIDQSAIPLDKLSYYQPRIAGYKADAHFFIALQYFELMRRYGSVPIVKKAYEVSEAGDLANAPRNPLDEVSAFISAECDSAANILPTTYEVSSPSEIGRITKGAAMSLKAIALLYAASPLFNGNTAYASLKNTDGSQLFSQTYDANKWKSAADAAKAVIDLNMYSLNNPNPSNPIDNYARLFYTREYKETILPLLFGSNSTFEQNFLPNGQDGQSCGGFGKLSIFQTMVDAYEMSNGLPITDPNSGYISTGFWSGKIWDGKAYRQASNLSNMYKNRDPRFYATIFFQYAFWDSANHTRPIKYAYYGNANGATDGWPKGGTNCETGYGLRKYNNPDVNLKTGNGTTNKNFPLIRYPEILLTYAEAMNEYEGTPTQAVYDAINLVRARVSMPALPITASDRTKEGMRERIHNEWRIEFAFENHRFWDVRRWLIGSKVDNGAMYGLNARPTVDERNATGFDAGSEAEGVAVFYKQVVNQNRIFTDRDYLFPIPQIEINKSTALIQNPGW